MKRFTAFCLALCVSGLFPLAASAQSSPTPGTQSWETQLEQMGYLLLHISSINVIQGINLTREQALALRDMARNVEKACPPVPVTGGGVLPGVREVRDTYLELREQLLGDGSIPEELRDRVHAARATESKLVRQSLMQRSAGPTEGRCTACHSVPGVGYSESGSLPPMNTGQAERAHFLGVYGRRGAMELMRYTPEIDTLLTSPQKAMFADFSCCLVPPQELSDPVRIGQAPASGPAGDLLERIREIPAVAWPFVSSIILDKLMPHVYAARPGISEAEAAHIRQKAYGVFTEARSLPDVDFALEKEALCARLDLRPERGEDDIGESFRYAFFLLMPGTAEVYDRLLEKGTLHSSPASARPAATQEWSCTNR